MLHICSWSDSAGCWMRFASSGIDSQASWTTLSSCSHARLRSLRQWSERNGFARLLLLRARPGVLESRWGVDGPHWSQTVSAARRWLRCGQCWSSVERWETGGVSHDPSCGPNGDLGDTKEGIVWRCKLFSSRSDSA